MNKLKIILILSGLLFFAGIIFIIRLASPHPPRNRADTLYRAGLDGRIVAVDYMHDNILTVKDTSQDTISWYFALDRFGKKNEKFPGELFRYVSAGDLVLKERNTAYFDVIKQENSDTLRFYFTIWPDQAEKLNLQRDN